jgi:hypothetical protein
MSAVRLAALAVDRLRLRRRAGLRAAAVCCPRSQLHGPAREIDEAVPALHKPLEGALLMATPFDAPQAPLTSGAATVAVGVAVADPPLPEQAIE